MKKIFGITFFNREEQKLLNQDKDSNGIPDWVETGEYPDEIKQKMGMVDTNPDAYQKRLEVGEFIKYRQKGGIKSPGVERGRKHIKKAIGFLNLIFFLITLFIFLVGGLLFYYFF